MCVIAIKPKGVKMPPDTFIENMWYHNSDGAGFMYANGKNVIIDKGYMDLGSFRKAIKDLEKKIDIVNTALIMHFRIGTAGGNIPANTHPFPISDSIPVLQKLNCTTKMGIVHNGIINITPRTKNISDTMEWIASELAALYRYDKEFYRNKALMQMIGNRTGSKLAFMNPDGEIFTVGNFIEEDGMRYSNSSYSYYTYYRRTPVHAYSLLTDGKNDEEDWIMHDYGFYVDHLMLLADGDFVIDMETGNYYDADDVTMFVDESGDVYVYDDYTQSAYAVANDCVAFNKEGLTIKFDPEKASEMIIDNDELIDLEDVLYNGDENQIKLTAEELEKAAADFLDEKEEPEVNAEEGANS